MYLKKFLACLHLLFMILKMINYISKDIVGEKPLYNCNEEYLAFSSDLKPFKNLNFYKKDINKIAVKVT